MSSSSTSTWCWRSWRSDSTSPTASGYRVQLRTREHAPFTLRTLKLLDDRFATPAYILLLITGFGMVFEADIPIFDTFWIVASLVIYVAVVVVGIFFYSPVLRRQTEIAESGMADSDDYRQLSKRNMRIGGLLVIMVLAIEFLMVTKPTM